MASERRVSRPASLPVETISGQSVITPFDAKKRPSPSRPRRRRGEVGRPAIGRQRRPRENPGPSVGRSGN